MTSQEAGDRIGIVAIGRNEGDRLVRCLNSAVASSGRVVYVDSGSSDGSVSFAESIGVHVVEIDDSIPFTAARARNLGARRLTESWPDTTLIQFVDGDCEIAAGWLQTARDFIMRHPQCAVVCGRRRERDPGASIYNRLTDLEWDTPVGVVSSCGGDAMFRRSVFDEVGGFRDGMIAGEEPELCVRIRGADWEIHRIDSEMTLHDAALSRFGQFWRRALRAGHAFAERASLHGGGEDPHAVRSVRSAIVWGLLLPLLALVLAVPSVGLSVGGFVFLLVIQVARITRREIARGRDRGSAILVGIFVMIAKPAQLLGILLYHRRRIARRRASLIEYK